MKKLSKILALALALCLMMSVCAFAAEGDKKDGAMPEGDKKDEGMPAEELGEEPAEEVVELTIGNVTLLLTVYEIDGVKYVKLAELAPEEDAAPAASAEGVYVVTFSYGETVEIAAGEELVFTISCSAPTDMGAPADGEEGAGVTTTSGVIAYSDITLGGPNNYPTAETVTISGIDSDCTVTITPNEAEQGDFPAISFG